MNFGFAKFSAAAMTDIHRCQCRRHSRCRRHWRNDSTSRPAQN